VEGYVGPYAQSENYSCGPIAINRFAVLLKGLSDGNVLGDGIDELIKFMDSDKENVANAKCLFQCLLEKRHDLFNKVDNEEPPMAESPERMAESPERMAESPETNRKEAAKAMASLGAMPISQDTGTTPSSVVVKDRKRPLPIHSPSNGCHASPFCRLDDILVVLEGNNCNGSFCCKCQQSFHYVCLFVFEGDVYCIKCYNENVVSQCTTETLFCDLFESQDRANAQTHPKGTESDLLQFVDNFFKANGYEMTTKQYLKWIKKVEKYEKQKEGPKGWTKEERKERLHINYANRHKKNQYKTIFELAKEEWLLSTDGLVRGLRYKPKEKEFVAKVVYEKNAR
jgi:hypothetical protein